MPSPEIINCQTATNLLEELSPRSRTFSSASPSEWLFRGQALAEWDLRPTAFRDESKLVYSAAEDHRDWANWTNADQIAAEADTVISFADEADRAGLPLPGDLGSLHYRLRRLLLHGYMPTEENGQLQWPPRSTWEVVALAQHYGLATRFLDWTYSSYVATYFAASDAVREQRTGKMAIWAFSMKTWHVSGDQEYLPRYPAVVTAPYASNPNLRAQRAVHLAVPLSLELSEAAQREDYTTLLMQVDASVRRHGHGAFKKFTLDTKHAPHLLWHLAKEGVTAAQLFPGYAGAARSVLELPWQRPE